MPAPLKLLAVVETAYRATLEEQDDPVLWLTQVLRNNGADIHVLLRGNAVNYGVRGQDASGLRFGEVAQTNPPNIERDIGGLLAKGTSVFVVSDDVKARGIDSDEILGGLRAVTQADLPELFGGYDQIWHW